MLRRRGSLLLLAALATLAVAVGTSAVATAQTSGPSNSSGQVEFWPSIYFPGLEQIEGVRQDTATGRYSVTVTPTTLGEYIVALYKFFTGATAIVAMFMVTYGGLLWLLAGGNQGSISHAKEVITGAIAGMVIALLSYALLATISRGLVEFKSLDTRLEARLGQDSTSSGPDLGCANPQFQDIITTDAIDATSGGASFTCANIGAVESLVVAAQNAFDQTNARVLLTSAYRSRTRQEQLYDENTRNSACRRDHPADWKTQCGSGDATPPTCNPWLSRGCPHTTGYALDVRCSGQPEYGECQLALEQSMIEQGFCRLANETWHFEKPPVSSNCVGGPVDGTGYRSGCPTCCNSLTNEHCEGRE